MPNEKGTSDDKKARLEAIRAANAAKRTAAGDGDEPTTQPTVAISTTPADAPPAVATAAAPAAAAPAAVGANMSDDKKARLESIRAAKRAGDGGTATVEMPPNAGPGAAGTATPAAAATGTATAPRPAPGAAAAAPAAAKPAVRIPATPQPPRVVEDDTVPLRNYLTRAVVGAVLGMILCVLLAKETGHYALGAIWGVLMGAPLGMLVLSWPPKRTTGE